MSVRVKVRAVIWVGESIVVHRVERRGEIHVTLPGGRVNDRESITDALRREVLEEIGVEIEVIDLLFVAEVLSGARRQDLELIFKTRAKQPIDPQTVELVDPGQPHPEVLPPVLHEIAARRHGDTEPSWLGNIYTSGADTAAPAAR